MTDPLRLIALLAVLGLAACTEPQTYPVSGEECTEDDPVRTLDASDCLPPTGAGAGGF